MNLGCLVTITAQAPQNLSLILFDNGVYEITGRQGTPGSSQGRQNSAAINFAEIARACGFETVFEFHDLTSWQQGVTDVVDADGLVFCSLRVAPIEGDTGPKSPGSAWLRAAALRESFTADA